MNKKSILIVHNYYQITGGEDTVVANEKKLLEEHGLKVVIYSRNNSELKTMGIPRKLLLPFTTVFSLKTYRNVKKIIRSENIDAVHVHNTLNLISPSIYYAAFACKVPVIQTIHNFRLLCPGATFYRDGHICEDCITKGLSCAIKHSCYRGSKLETLACVISTKVHRLLGTYKWLNYICLTEFNKEKLLGLKQIRKEQVFVKPNFVDAKCNIMRYDDRKNQYVYAGRIDKLKGVDILLDAWRIMGEDAPELIICGTGTEEEWCSAYIAENHLSTIKMMGFVPNKQVRDIIAESKALILPTQWYEGFPMVIVEAYASGTPVIGSNIGNVGSLIKDGVTGYKFQYDSPEALTKAISCMMDMVESTKHFYKSEYTSDMNYNMLNQIYALAKIKAGQDSI